MGKLENLPAEIVCQIAEILGTEEDCYRSLCCFSSASKFIHTSIQQCHSLWLYAYATSWQFNDAGRYGRSSDLYGDPRVKLLDTGKPWQPLLAPGKELPTAIMTPYEAFQKRQAIDRAVQDAARSALTQRKGRLDATLRVLQYGADALDMIRLIQIKAECYHDKEVEQWCFRLTGYICSTLGDRLLRHHANQPRPSSSWDEKPPCPALDIISAGILYENNMSLERRGCYLTEIRLIASGAQWVLSNQLDKHDEGCPRFMQTSPLHCHCLKATQTCVSEIAQILAWRDIYEDDCRSMMETILNGSLGLTLIFCAVAAEIGFQCWPVQFQPDGIVAVAWVDASGTERMSFYFTDDLLDEDEPLVDQELELRFGISQSIADRKTLQQHVMTDAIDIAKQAAECRHAMFDDPFPDPKSPRLYVDLLQMGIQRMLFWGNGFDESALLKFTECLSVIEPVSTQVLHSDLIEAYWKVASRPPSTSSTFEKTLAPLFQAGNAPILPKARPNRLPRFTLGAVVRLRGRVGIITYVGVFNDDSRSLEHQNGKSSSRASRCQFTYRIFVKPGRILSSKEEDNEIDVVSCAACGDRLAHDFSHPMKAKTGSYIQVLVKRWEENPELQLLFRTTKNGGRCGFTASRRLAMEYHLARWPPAPFACYDDDDISVIDDKIFGAR